MADAILSGAGLGYGSYGANGGLLSSIWGFLASVTGVSVFTTLLSGGAGQTGPLAGASQWKILSVLVLGFLVEIGRRLCLWILERFRFQYYITAEFHEGDPTYDWIILLLTHEKIWKRTKNFRVTSKTSQRKWSVRVSRPTEEEIADYVPTFGHPQLWRWNGYWIEVTRDSVSSGPFSGNPHAPYDGGANSGGSSIYLRIYSLDMSVLSRILEAARAKYLEVSRPFVIVHALDPQDSYNVEITWNNVKRKAKRPLESIILEEGVFEGLLADAKEFIDMEEWYADAGIPHRRGYLLYGPPGTGKSSTIYGLAGELGMEIYSLSLAAHFVDDFVLERAATSIPKNSILLIEDIDCAFPSREEIEWMESPPNPFASPPVSRRSAVTLSGLLNVLDGVGSEEGKLFFATSNYIDHLDPALLRPGRIDKKIQYKLANSMQAEALFKRFYPLKHSKLWDHHIYSEKSTSDEKQGAGDDRVMELARSFADKVPENEFTTAELQGYLLEHKKNPLSAVEELLGWVENERTEREEKKKREEERKAKAKANAKLAEYGSPFPALPSPGRPPMEIDVLPPSPAPSACPVVCACKASLLPADGEAGEEVREGQAPATPPAEKEDVVVVNLAEEEKA